jgi:hypothetical protein
VLLENARPDALKRLHGGGLPFWNYACDEGKWNDSFKENKNLLWTIFVVLLLLWALGLVTAYTMGGVIHLLLVFALVVLVIQLIQGRRVV